MQSVKFLNFLKINKYIKLSINWQICWNSLSNLHKLSLDRIAFVCIGNVQLARVCKKIFTENSHGNPRF